MRHFLISALLVLGLPLVGLSASHQDSLTGVRLAEVRNGSRPLKSPLPVDKAVMFVSIQNGCGADKAGVKPGDVLFRINSRQIQTERDFQHWLTTVKSGDSYVFKVYRVNHQSKWVPKDIRVKIVLRIEIE